MLKVKGDSRLGHLCQAYGQHGVASVDGAKGVGEVVVDGGVEGVAMEGEVSPMVGLVIAEGVEGFLVSGVVNLQVERHHRVASTPRDKGVYGPDSVTAAHRTGMTCSVAIIPLAVNP